MTAKRQDLNDPPEFLYGFPIGDLARRFGITTRTLRFYEQRGLLSSARVAGQVRLFSPEQVDRLQSILKAKDMGFTLEEIRGFLSAHDRGENNSVYVTPDDEVLRSQLSTLEKRRDEIDAAIMELRDALRKKNGAAAPQPRAAPTPLRRRGGRSARRPHAPS